MNDQTSALSPNSDASRFGRLSYWPSYFLLLIFLVSGATLTVVGLLMPAYTDPIAVDRIRLGSECEIGVPNPKRDESPPCESEVWHRSMDNLRTYKWRLVDLGNGIMASALALSVFAMWQARKSRRTILTPKRAISILVLAAVAWLAIIPASTMLFFAELERDYYPWWADSIAIPIFETEVAVLVLLLPYVALWSIFVVGARLPVPILLTVPNRPFVNIGWSAAAILLLFLPTVFGLVITIIDGPILMVPFLWLMLWLTLCARAAALSRHMPKAELSQA